MPQVPKYNGNVQENGIPTDRVPIQSSIESFGGGEGVTGVAKQAQDLVQKGRDAADKVQILDSHAKATELKNKILHGYTNEAGEEVLGALKQQGKNALGLPETVQKEYEDGIQKITEGLNPRQQNMFRAASDEIRLSVNDKVRAHVSAESYKVQIQSMKTSIGVNKQDAISNFEDDKQRDIAIVNIGASIRAGGKMAGWDDAMIEQTIREEVSSTNKEIVERYLNKGDYSGADQYFKNNYKSFTGEHQSDVDKLVKAGSQEAQAFKLADSLTSSEALKKGMTEKKAIAILRDETNPQIRKVAEQRVEHFFGQQERAKDESQKNLNIRIAQELRKNGGNYGAQEVQNLLRGASMDLDKSAQSYAQFVKNGGKSSDPLAYDELESRLKSTDPQVRNGVTQAEISDLSKPLNETGERSRDTLLKLFSKNALNDEAFLKSIGDFASESDLVKQKVIDAGIDPKSEQAKLLESRMKAEVRAQQQLQEKPLHKEDKIKILDRMMLEDSYGFFGRYGGPVFKYFGSDYRFTAKIDDIPDRDIADITEALTKKKGKKPTDEQILYVYNSRK